MCIRDRLISDDLNEKFVIDMGTTKVYETRIWAKEIEEKGGHFIDAPVSGGQVGAETGTLSIMAGCSQSDLEKVNPIFEVLGKNILSFRRYHDVFENSRSSIGTIPGECNLGRIIVSEHETIV